MFDSDDCNDGIAIAMTGLKLLNGVLDTQRMSCCCTADDQVQQVVQELQKKFGKKRVVVSLQPVPRCCTQHNIYTVCSDVS